MEASGALPSLMPEAAAQSLALLYQYSPPSVSTPCRRAITVNSMARLRVASGAKLASSVPVNNPLPVVKAMASAAQCVAGTSLKLTL
ncbi:hypothetical protein D3C72_1806640 [compost metagenome]